MAASASSPPEGPRRSDGGEVHPLGGRGGEVVPQRPTGTDESDHVLALDLLRALADQELTRAERFSTRARQAFALAAGFFAIVQTVAFGSFAGRLITPAERIELLDRAWLAGVLLTACGVALIIADSAFRSRNVSEDQILETVNLARAEQRPVTDDFVELYAGVVSVQRRTNRFRFFATLAAQLLALASILAVLSQLLYSLDARIS